MDNHEEEIPRAGAPSALSVELESLRADNARLWKMIKDAQDASNAAGLIGMIGSTAWIWQIKKALSNAKVRGCATAEPQEGN